MNTQAAELEQVTLERPREDFESKGPLDNEHISSHFTT